MYVFQPPPPSVQPTARRVRVRLGHTVVADSSRAILLTEFGPDGFPTYYLPFEDVRPGVLTDEAGGRFAVVAGDRRVPDAAYTDDRFDELKGHVTFSWETLDWYEEDEQVFCHARPPNHRVDALRGSRHVEVFLGGQRLANSTRPVLVFETFLPTRYYLPAADVRLDLLTPSETVTRCPYKGVARYWSHPAVADVAWSYPDPIPENPRIRDLVCFFDERVDIVVDGEPQERPATPFA